MIEHFQQINDDIWEPFERCYAHLDLDAFVDLFAPDLIRVSLARDRVQDHAGMVEDATELFTTLRERGDLMAIDFRFTERIASDELASERGVFRIVMNPRDGESRAVYGRFHIFARRTDGRWRLAVDYDSADATVDDFSAAVASDDLEPFAGS